MASRGAAGRLSAEAFARLLARLDPDPERAGEAYESLRRTLIAFFTWRGAATPDECADDTLDRLAARLADGVAVQDVRRFAAGIARLVLLEHWRDPALAGVPLADARPLATGAEPSDERAHACLDRCLAELPEEARKLILDYYVAQGRGRIEARKAIASRLGVSESALRNRAQRLRDRLERCLAACLADTEA